MDEIYRAFKEAIERRPRLIISTGGLGPTPDDRTIGVLAKLAKRKVIVDKGTLVSISKRRQISLKNMSEFFVKMARTIEGTKCVTNPVGIVPSTILNFEKTIVIALPGPPREAKSIFSKNLKRIIESETSCRSLSKRVLVNMRESEVSPIIEQIMSVGKDTYLKPLVGKSDPKYGLPIEVIVFDKDKEKCEEKMNGLLRLFKNLVHEKGRTVVG